MNNPYPWNSPSWKLWQHFVHNGYEPNGDLKDVVDAVADHLRWVDDVGVVGGIARQISLFNG